MEVKRATFEMVQKAQEDLIFSDDGIDKLAELNETVDVDSRAVFFERLAKALCGKELDYPFVLTLEDGTTENLGSVAVFARKMAYFTDTKDNLQPLKIKGKIINVSMTTLWVTLRESIYKPMAEALTLSMKSSQELFRGSVESFGASPETKITE